MNAQSIFITQKHQLYPFQTTGNNVLKKHVQVLIRNFATFGYTLSDTTIDTLYTISLAELKQFYFDCIQIFQTQTLKNAKKLPFHRIFPYGCLDRLADEQFLDAVYAAFTNTEYKSETMNINNQHLTVLSLGTEKEFNHIFTALCSSKSLLSHDDKTIVQWFIQNKTDDIARLFPEVIPNRQNFAFIVAHAWSHEPLFQSIQSHVCSATDALRIACLLCGGDPSLAEPTVFASFKRADRRKLLALIEGTSNIEAAMRKHREYFKRFGERLHPTEWQKKFPNTAAAFDAIRNRRPETLHAKVERAMLAHDAETVFSLLIAEPNEFARRLAVLLRVFPTESVLQHFEGVAHALDTKRLLKLLAYFSEKSVHPVRIFHVQGTQSTLYGVRESRPPLSTDTQEAVIHCIQSILIEKFTHRPHLGKVYIDPNLANYTVPFHLLSTKREIQHVGNGTVMKLNPNSDVYRVFFHCTDLSDKIAMHVSLCDPNFEKLMWWNFDDHVGATLQEFAHTDLGYKTFFVDLQLDYLLRNNVRYVYISISNYTGQSFASLPTAFLGVSENVHTDDTDCNTTPVNKGIDLTSEESFITPLFIDLHSRELIWGEVPQHFHSFASKLVTNLSVTKPEVMNRLLHMPNISLHTLFRMHAQARGEIVDCKDEADTIFSVDEGILATDTTRILSDFV
ncbi:MAG: hypothetical protein ACRC5C_10020 [Bacilli bacterium]